MYGNEHGAESLSHSVKIRLATNRDAPLIKQLVFSVLTEFGLTPDPEGLDEDLNDVESTYLASGGLFEVVESGDGAIVGTAGLVIRTDGKAELRKMYLRKDFRGRGLGRILLERMLNHARAKGVRVVELETNSSLQSAVRLYRAYGFELVNRAPISWRCDQVYQLSLRPLDQNLPNQ